ncbi:MAG: PilZ domain-containing protein [Thermodesulfobacteriota bacterium]|nr:PilZ domain-containing protein [Thermodesulfobacteriota bacterium]
MAERPRKKNVQILNANTDITLQEKEEIFQATPQAAEASNIGTGKQLTKEYLINKLNFINFQDSTILINFKHIKYDLSISLHAMPKPCSGNQLDCVWVETDGIDNKIHSYKFKDFSLVDGTKLISVTPEVSGMNNKGISFILPETCYEISYRKVARHSCEGINVQFIQNSSFFYGILIDFNAVSFCVELTAVPPQTFQWLDKSLKVNIILSDESETLYGGECNIIKSTGGRKTRQYILEPLERQIQRYQQKDHRSKRQKIMPSPDIVFRHPFTKKLVRLKATDISGSGFSAEEKENMAVLLPGMIIPEVELNFADKSSIKCKAQVLYRQISCGDERGIRVKCGIAVLDMRLEDNMKLLSILHHEKESNAYVCNRVDMDDLWDFFFETGFIYPNKYEFIQKNKAKIKDTYEKLYTQNQNIARHFIYQDKGRILGHMALVRFYSNTWLIHHHAARKAALNRAGLIVLNQLGDFAYNCHRLYSLHMSFLIGYFRPDNKFANRVFGGAAKNIKNPKKCSVDAFAYFHFENTPSIKHEVSGQWELTETRREDLVELEKFYEHESGGLMLSALDLEPEMDDLDELVKEYQRYGFKRKKYLFSLKMNKMLKAIVLVNISDIGLNLSDLTNGTKVIVLDNDELSRGVLYWMLSLVSEKTGQENVSILLFPAVYAEQKAIPFEKIYNLWISRTQNSDEYFSYVDRLLRFT